MPDIKFAAADVSAMKLGTTNISKVMLGTVQVWPTAATCTDVITLEPFNNFTDNAWTLGGSPTIVTARNGTGAQVSGSTASATYAFSSDTVTLGFAWRYTDGTTTQRDVLRLTSDAAATVHNRMNYTPSSGLLIVTRFNTTVGSTTITLTQNTWYYIELQATLHDSTGALKVRVAGTEVISFTGDTKNAGTAAVYEQLRIGVVAAGQTNQYDDLYLRTGSTCTFRGDINPPVCTDVIVHEDFDDLSAWTTSGTPTIVTGRTGTAMQTNGPTHYATFTIPTIDESDRITIGVAYKLSTLAQTTTAIAELLSDAGVTQHNRLEITSAGAIRVTRGISGGTVIASNVAHGLTANNWSYIEWQIMLHDTAGFTIVKVDGVEKINTTGLDTKNAGTKTTYDTVRLIGTTSVTSQWDDLYLSTGSGCTFEGDPAPVPRYFKVALGNNALVTTATSLAITTTAPIAVGDLVVVRVASDNISASTPTYTCADSGGNTYTTHSERNSGQASAGAGVAGALMATKATNAVAAGGTITVTASATVTNLVLYAESFIGFNNTTRSTPVTAIGAVADGTAVSVTSGTVNSGDLVVGSAHAETRTAPASGDSDTLNGSWSTIVSRASSASGTDNLRTIVAGQYKIATGSGAQTWNIVNGVAADWSAVIVVLQAT